MAPRDPDDDAPHRIRAAHEYVVQNLSRDPDADDDDAPGVEPTETALGQMIDWGQARIDTTRLERKLARARSVLRVRRMTMSIAGLLLAVGIGWTVWHWQTPSRLLVPSVLCAALIGLCIVGAIADARLRSPGESLAKLEDDLELHRQAARIMGAMHPTPLPLRRGLYREDVAALVEQYEADSRKYRTIHNRLQTLIMVGSASTTTIAALDTGKDLTWQSASLTFISFAITVAAMFTGYYKFRERSYFLQQTADAIEEEANAVTLGIGSYRKFGPEQEQEALKLFTQRVEDHRNEQRRRQQQLDQPSDQAGSSSQPPA